MKRGLVLIVIFLLFIQTYSVSAVVAVTQPASSIVVNVDGSPTSLTSSTSSFSFAGHTYSSISSLSMGQHDASQVWVSVKDGEMTLLQALQSTNKLCSNLSNPITYSSSPSDKSKPYHFATEVIGFTAGNFQQAINAGAFCCIPSCPDASTICVGTTYTGGNGCGGSCSVVGAKPAVASYFGTCTSTSCTQVGAKPCLGGTCGGSTAVCTPETSTPCYGTTCSSGTCNSATHTCCTSTGCAAASTVCNGVAYTDNCGTSCGTGTKPVVNGVWSDWTSCSYNCGFGNGGVGSKCDTWTVTGTQTKTCSGASCGGLQCLKLDGTRGSTDSKSCTAPTCSANCLGGTYCLSGTCTSCPSCSGWSNGYACNTVFQLANPASCGGGNLQCLGRYCSSGTCTLCLSTGKTQCSSSCPACTCPSSSTINCGVSYNDNCGKFCGTGTKCATGDTCSGGSCVPSCTATNSYWGACSATACGTTGTKTCIGATCGGSNTVCNPGQVQACNAPACCTPTCATTCYGTYCTSYGTCC